MGKPLFTNNASTTLAVALLAGDTSMSVLTGGGAGFPAPTAGDYCWLTLQAPTGGAVEIVKASARSGDTFSSLSRGQQGTIATGWPVGTVVELRSTAQVFTDLWAATLGIVNLLPLNNTWSGSNTFNSATPIVRIGLSGNVPQPGGVTGAPLQVSNAAVPSMPAIVGYATSVGAGSGSQGTIGLCGYAESSTTGTSAYGVYGEARLLPNGHYVEGAEFTAVNQKSATPGSVTTLSAIPADNLCAALWLSAGRGDLTPNYPISCGIGIVSNGTTYDRGIVIQSGALSPLANTALVAMQVGPGARLTWGYDDAYIAMSNTGSYISTCLFAYTSAGGPVLFEITPTGLYYTNNNHGRTLVAS